MIRIVGVQRDPRIGQEFVLLQNQGNMRVNLKGHAVVAEVALLDPDTLHALHLFRDNEDIMPGQFVLLRTCPGEGHWITTQEGTRVYYAYMNRTQSVWDSCEGALHILFPQHTYVERQREPLFV